MLPRRSRSFWSVVVLLAAGCGEEPLLDRTGAADDGEEAIAATDSGDAGGQAPASVTDRPTEPFTPPAKFPCADAVLGSELPLTASGWSGGHQGHPKYSGSCYDTEYGTGEQIFQWVVPKSGVFRIRTTGATFGPSLYVRARTCSGPERACAVGNYFRCTNPELELFALAGELLFIFVDAPENVNAGEFNLVIEEKTGPWQQSPGAGGEDLCPAEP